MAASYSSFLTSQFYSPVFNTALFDGPFRFYFSQSYEATALKLYHLLQSDHYGLWMNYKAWSEKNKKNVFILIYPSQEDVSIAFQHAGLTPLFQNWDDGIVIGMENSSDEKQDEKFKDLYKKIVAYLESHLKSEKQVEGEI